MPENIVWVDILIPGIILVSALLSLMRGFVREALSLLGWLAALVVALRFSQPFAELLLASISVPSLRVIVAFAILFVLTLVLAAIVNRLAYQLVRRTGLTGTDRVIGVAFGAVRGVVIIAVLVLLAEYTQLPQDPWWRESVLVVHFQQLAHWLNQTIAPEIMALTVK